LFENGGKGEISRDLWIDEGREKENQELRDDQTSVEVWGLYV
jgi:hypothetical protein